jgi:hypothetical protein
MKIEEVHNQGEVLIVVIEHHVTEVCLGSVLEVS